MGVNENPPVGGAPAHIALLLVTVVVHPETVATDRVTSLHPEVLYTGEGLDKIEAPISLPGKVQF